MNPQEPLSVNPSCPLPRVLRAKSAPGYLGMSREVFNQEVKLYVTVVPIGRQGIGYDRFELEAWWEHYKQCNGRPTKQFLGGRLCQNHDPCHGYSLGTVSSISISATSILPEGDFAEALALVNKTSILRKPV